MTAVVDHSLCNHAWKQVRCDRCGAEYQCTPSSDFYCTEGDHCCEPCLRGRLPITTFAVPIVAPQTKGGDR